MRHWVLFKQIWEVLSEFYLCDYIFYKIMQEKPIRNK